LLASTVALHAQAQTIDAQKAAKVKAAYVLNFLRYTQWPGGTFESPSSPIDVTVVGDCLVADVLAEAARRSPPIDGHGIAVEAEQMPARAALDPDRLRDLEERLRRSNLVYLCSRSALDVETLVRGLGDAPTLTVGDEPGFASRGGMLGFVLRGSRILFQANLEAIRTSRVAVSAKVLKLAEVVTTGGS